ncbi:AIPR protein [Aureimonas altamirensis DSM 21988]|uniref:AIPR protein n=1 Tax=Aureimonas altamirensis DSM 21988 TaxID=1121026 RepID=A0ABY1I8H0_9HYPH|nr:AIPR family protein [Aureimonas altamirensis]SHI66337.1 AIPR protein [Aureimonas altamirensis DSM 21988]
MSSLKVRQTESKLLGLFEQHLDLHDIGPNDPERRVKILSRCLAAFAVFNETGCSEQEAASAVWDGGDDNGLDAVFHEAADKRIIVVQSKWIKAGTGEPEAKDLAAFANGVKDLVEDEMDHFGSRLHARFAEVSQALLTPGATISIVLISTGASVLAPHGTTNLDRILKELNAGVALGDEPMASKQVFGLSEVYARLASSAVGEAINLQANIYEWSHVTTPYPAYVGSIDGLQLKDWWTTYGRRLVAKNIRHSLGSTDVNEQIRQTATSDPDHFWYYNNGITLIAETSLKAPRSAASRTAGIFEFQGASIVNGAQTVSTLGRIEQDEKLGKVRVPIRIILLNGAPNNFGAEVTRTNNLQNRVEGRDFAAQDPQQSRLQQEMGIEDIEYQFLRSDTFIPSDRSCDIIEVTTALACAAADASLAVQLKTGIGRFFGDITRAPYKAIFNPSLSGAKAFNSTVVQRKIDLWIENKKKEVSKRSGYPWGVLIHGNRILAASVFKNISSDLLSKPIHDFSIHEPKIDIESICKRVYNSMVNELEKEYPNKFLAVLFKNPSMSKHIFDLSST